MDQRKVKQAQIESAHRRDIDRMRLSEERKELEQRRREDARAMRLMMDEQRQEGADKWYRERIAQPFADRNKKEEELRKQHGYE